MTYDKTGDGFKFSLWYNCNCIIAKYAKYANVKCKKNEI